MPNPDLKLELEARPENVAVARQALAALAEAMQLEERRVSDIKLAVSEACSNVVLHAYPNGRGGGDMLVLASATDEALTVAVYDQGRGIAPRPDSPGLGLGLLLIANVSDRLEVGTTADERTEVRMTFMTGNGHPHEPERDG